MHDSGFIHRDGTCRALINAIKNLWHVFDVVQPILLLAYCFVRLENSLALPVGRYVNNAEKSTMQLMFVLKWQKYAS